MYLYKALASKWTEAASTVATSVSNKTPSMRSISNAGFALSLSSVISDKLVRIVHALCAALMFALISFNCIAEMAPIFKDMTFQDNFFRTIFFRTIFFKAMLLRVMFLEAMLLKRMFRKAIFCSTKPLGTKIRKLLNKSIKC